jgi:uncharacterized protein (DUF1778 family)
LALRGGRTLPRLPSVVAALILPPSPACLDLPAGVREGVLASWAAWWEPLRDKLRKEPPTEDSAEERAALVRFVTGTNSILRQLGPAVLPLLQSGIDQALIELLNREDASAPTERRLGLRFLERAVETLGEFLDTVRRVAPESLVVEAEEATEVSDEESQRELDPASVTLVRLELAVFMAFDLVAGSDTREFVVWARAAKTAAGRAAPYVTQLATERALAVAEDASPDLVLSTQAFNRVVELLENPPAPSARLCELVRRGPAQA